MAKEEPDLSVTYDIALAFHNFAHKIATQEEADDNGGRTETNCVDSAVHAGPQCALFVDLVVLFMRFTLQR